MTDSTDPDPEHTGAMIHHVVNHPSLKDIARVKGTLAEIIREVAALRQQLAVRHREDQRWIAKQVKAALEKQAGQIEAWKALAEARDRALADMYALHKFTEARADRYAAEVKRLRALIGEANNAE